MKKITLLFICLIPLLVKAHDTDWSETNKTVYAKCLNPEYFTDFNVINPALYATICSFLAKNPNLSYTHHDDVRFFVIRHAPYKHRQMRSMHHNGGALDWRAHSYKGLNQCERYVAFSQWVPKFYRHLMKTGLSEKTGLGLYPEQDHPFIHFDLRGEKARWSRIDGDINTPWEVGWKWLKEKIKECKEN